MKYNRSEIMKEAWAMYRQNAWMFEMGNGFSRGHFAKYMETAWFHAKSANETAEERASFAINMKDRWDDEDRAEISRLEKIIAAA